MYVVAVDLPHPVIVFLISIWRWLLSHPVKLTLILERSRQLTKMGVINDLDKWRFPKILRAPLNHPI